jgi:hypothetical protein
MRTCFSKNVMPNAHGRTRLGILARTSPGSRLSVGSRWGSLATNCTGNNAHSLAGDLSNWLTGTLRKYGLGGTVNLASVLVLAATHITWELDRPLLDSSANILG